MAKDREVVIFAHLDESWVPCGLLTMTEEGATLLASSYAYGTRYLDRPGAVEIDPVSLGTHGAPVKGKVLLPVNDLTGFGGIRDAAPDSWGRRVIEAKLKAPANSLRESDYLLHAGSNRVGALDVRPSRDSEPLEGAAGRVHDLERLLAAAERIDEGLPVPSHLEQIFIQGSALGGARPKATVRDGAGYLTLAKFPTRKDAFDIPVIEAATLRLASAAGLNVPAVETVMLNTRRVMMIRRFDRYWLDKGVAAGMGTDLTLAPANGRTERRMAFVSGLTMVGCDELESNAKAYADLAEAVRKYCHPSVIRQDSEELYKRMVFNVLVNNDDDHLRNHGFIWDPALPGWRLSPLYDVLPRPAMAADRYLHLGVGPEGRSATMDNALAGAARFSITPTRAGQLIAQVWAIVREWRVVFEGYGVQAQDIEKIASAFRHIDVLSTVGTRKLIA
ncbi:HipA domain-containing protein [Achromobacter sp. Marseille-Q0513]|uniref:type II toxin-antitoxin system HipA family toxin n=1 Tax=Achromobacter sp. Marseille-Q0513 TaxID=2829161 RepID=UPI001B99F95F|nr:HipA domain-containing protein [Achromobacter sp. Marseille-Q0513]MBR8653441.1 HipA domain-containing protein [Achromobacter sp. Marseille-Q0513]